MVFAAELAGQAGLLAHPQVALHRELISAMGLPTSYRGDWAQLQQVMRVDKKARGATLRFVVLDGIGNPRILTDPDPSWLDAAWARRERRTHDDPGPQRREPRPARHPGAGDLRDDDLRPARRRHRDDRARARAGRRGPPDRRRGRAAALDPRGHRRRAPRRPQPGVLVAHLGRAARRPRGAEQPAGRGAHQQHPQARGVPAPLLRLRGGRRRHRRAGVEGYVLALQWMSLRGHK